MKTILLYLQVLLFISACAQQNKKVEENNLSNNNIELQDTDWTDKIVKTKEEWKKVLTPEQYNITREQGTE
nr:peptide-methionine (R)-S-oxide reductase [Bacteroidota bacterium]